MKKIKKLLIIAGLVGVGALGIYSSGVTVVPAGMAGIVYKANGGVSEKLITRGWNWTMPVLTKVSLYSTSIEQSYMCAGEKGDSKGDESFTLMTADGKEVKVDLEFSYKFKIDELPAVYEYHKGRDGETIEETFIKPKMITVANNVSTQFNVFDIYGSMRPKLNDEITKAAIEYFDDYGILIDRVSVTNVVPDDATKEAIQQKVDKLQEIEIAKSNTIIAEENSKKKLIEAKATADAKIIEAEAEKKANELKEKSLTEQILRQQWIEKWDGKLSVVGGSNVSPIIDMRDLE